MAERLAAHYGIRHHIRRVTREEFAADLPRILQAMDQPTIDGVNTWYASKAVAELGLKDSEVWSEALPDGLTARSAAAVSGGR